MYRPVGTLGKAFGTRSVVACSEELIDSDPAFGNYTFFTACHLDCRRTTKMSRASTNNRGERLRVNNMWRVSKARDSRLSDYGVVFAHPTTGRRRPEEDVGAKSPFGSEGLADHSDQTAYSSARHFTLENYTDCRARR